MFLFHPSAKTFYIRPNKTDYSLTFTTGDWNCGKKFPKPTIPLPSPRYSVLDLPRNMNYGSHEYDLSLHPLAGRKSAKCFYELTRKINARKVKVVFKENQWNTFGIVYWIRAV